MIFLKTRFIKKLFVLLLCVASVVSLSSCATLRPDNLAWIVYEKQHQNERIIPQTEDYSEEDFQVDTSENNNNKSTTAAVHEKTGVIKIELYPEYAPRTVANFLELVNQGYYNGKPFHRILTNNAAQAGDPDDDGTQNEGKTIFGEFAENGYVQNTLSHTTGVVSMGRLEDDPDSAYNQFFICMSDSCADEYDGKYAAFGRVVDGINVVMDFNNVAKTYNKVGEIAKPIIPITITNASQVEDLSGNIYVELTVSYSSSK